MVVSTVESPILEMFKYNRWANLQLLEACVSLTGEQLDTAAQGTYGSIRDTLFHIVDGEEDYLEVLTGEPPAAPPLTRELSKTMSLPELRERADKVGLGLVEAVRRVGIEDTYPRRFDGRIYSLPAPRFLVQLFTHSAEHRTHISTILTQLGVTLPEYEGWAYLHAMG